MEKYHLNEYKKTENPRQFWINLIDSDETKKLEEVDKLLELLMIRVKRNIDNLRMRLEKLGYLFISSSDNGINQNHIKELVKITREFGVVPESFIKFYEIVGSIDFRGYFPQWKEQKNVPVLDPILVLPVKDVLDYTNWHLKHDSNIFLDEKNNPYIWFAYDELTKDGVSGDGGGYGIKLLQDKAIDSEIVGYGIDLSFIDYLRFCFKWGGFPNLHWFQEELKDDLLFKEIKELGSSLIKF